MTASRLAHAVERYATALATLEDSPARLAPEQIIDILIARDAVRLALIDKTEDATAALVNIIQLDGGLKKQAGLISKTVKLSDWRATLSPPPEAWWWSLESLANAHRWDRFDWLWSVLTVVLLTGSLSLLIDVSSRFLSGGPDTFGAFAVIAQSMLTLLAAGGALTKAGREMIERSLASLNIPRHLWQEVKLGFALLVLLGLFSFRLSLPQIAIAYNNSGLDHYRAGRLASAQFDYVRALKLNPDYAEAHYNLGLLYEDLQDFEHAQTEYRIALTGGLDTAYNNLARLYILDRNYSAAVALLLSGLDRAQDEAVKYDMLKNLGWARLGQTRLAEAEAHVRDAIALATDRAPAHCLLAQVLEAQGDTASALSEWENCLKYADGRNPDEDLWIGLARQRLGDE